MVAAALVAAGLLAFGFSGGDRALTVGVAGGTPRSDASARVAADPAGRDWPHLRGPRHDAVSEETGLAGSWPPGGPPLLWAREVGRGYSGFVAVDGRVYTQAQYPYGQYVLCLDGETGRTIWERRYGWPYEATGRYPGPRATPTYAAQRVYFAGPEGIVECLDASDGRRRWSVELRARFGAQGFDFGYACSPLVADGQVILPAGGPGAAVVSLDAEDGATRWASGDEPASYSSAIPIRLGDRPCVAALLRNALAVFDRRTGRRLWRHNFSRGYDEHAALPLYEEPHLLIARPYRWGAALYRLDVARAGDPDATDERLEAADDLVWKHPQVSNDVASSLLIGGAVYGFDLRDVQSRPDRPSRGAFVCMDLLTGSLRWSTDRTGHATAITADGKLILFNDTGEVILARADAAAYDELARVRVFAGETCWTAPALHRGRLYLRTPTRAACLDLREAGRSSPGAAAGAFPLPAASRPFEGDRNRGPSERSGGGSAPTTGALAWGFLSCVAGVFGVAAALAGASAPRRGPGSAAASETPAILFWCAALALGALGPFAFGAFSDAFAFTWPAALFAAFQLALGAAVAARRDPTDRRGHFTARLFGLCFLGLCLVYFLACFRLRLWWDWAFLAGFLPAFPVGVIAARRLQDAPVTCRNAAWLLLAFSIYYVFSGFIMIRIPAFVTIAG